MRISLKHFVLFNICLVLILFSTFSGLAAPSRQILILDIPRFELADLTDGKLTNFSRLINLGAAGIVTNPLSAPLSMEKIYMSINSGTQIKTPLNSILFYDSAELYNGQPALEFAKTFLGVIPAKNGAVNTGNAKLIQANPVVAEKIGLLGKTLHGNGIKTAAIGNADSDIPNRSGAAMIMNEHGFIDYGFIGSETVKPSPAFPSGFQTDNQAVFTAWNQLRSKAGVIVVTLGDLERAERFSPFLTPQRWAVLRHRALVNYDPLIGQFMRESGEETLIILFSPLSSAIAGKKDSRLTNIVFTGPGFQPGVLVSPSTRHAGLVTCYDLSATIMNFMGIKSQDYFNGSALNSNPGDWQALIKTGTDLQKNFDIRWPLLTGYGFLMIAILAFWLLGFFLKSIVKASRVLYYAYLFLLTMPAIFLIEALFNPLDWLVVPLTLGLTGIVFLAALRYAKSDPFKAFSFISLFTVIVIVTDAFFNGACELRSFLGYSAVAGARFYGVGNEYMGVLLGAFIAFVSLNYGFFEKKRLLLWGTALFTAFLLIFSSFGASVGGGVTALLGLGVTVWFWQNRPVKLKEIFILLSSSILLLALSAWGEFFLHRQTHFGRFIKVIHSGSSTTVHEIIIRKLLLNLNLIQYTPLTLVLIGVLLTIPFLFKNPPKFIAAIISTHQAMARGLIGLSLTGLIAILLNDSGIVTAATLFLFGVPMIMAVTSRN